MNFPPLGLGMLRYMPRRDPMIEPGLAPIASALPVLTTQVRGYSFSFLRRADHMGGALLTSRLGNSFLCLLCKKVVVLRLPK
jgi:hypothetical protein